MCIRCYTLPWETIQYQDIKNAGERSVHAKKKKKNNAIQYRFVEHYRRKVEALSTFILREGKTQGTIGWDN